MPLLSFWASSDALSNQFIYPNFWRVVAPDSYLLFALTDFLTLHNFRHICVMFSATTRSMAMYRTLKNHLSLKRICVSRKMMVNETTNVTDLLTDLITDKLASRIIVVVGDHMLTDAVMSTVRGSKFEGHFLWIGNDFWEAYIEKNHAPRGSLAMHYNSVPFPDFFNYLRSLDTSNKNPWFLQALKDIDGCIEIQCIKRRFEKTIKNPSKVLALMHDCPFVFTHALDNFLKRQCPGLRGNQASDCFYRNFNEFPRYISEVKFKRNGQTFQFTNQHGFEVFSMIQSAFDKSPYVPLEISHFSLRRKGTVIINRISTSQLLIPYVQLEPHSYCMITCSAGEYRYYISRCCWKCMKCQDNQRVSEDCKTCERCPSLYWPRRRKDELEGDKCERIPPNYFDLFSPKYFSMIVFAFLGILGVVLIFVEYVKHRVNGIIKASSMELSTIQLAFILMGYLAVPVLVHRPTVLRCTGGALLFTVSFNISYFTMLLKAIRVYRIFSLSKNGQTIACTSQGFQVSACAAFLCCEVLRFFLINQFYPIDVGNFQPDFNVKYAEMACTIPSAQLIPFCVFALILLFLCSVYAFKTQTLPSNFKESRFVSMCVVTTLLIWAVFMPNYFTTQHFQLKMLYILLALLINHSTALLFLFLTRIIALHITSRRTSFLNADTFFAARRYQRRYTARRYSRPKKFSKDLAPTESNDAITATTTTATTFTLSRRSN